MGDRAKDRRIQSLRGVAAMLVVVLHARETLSRLHRPAPLIETWIPDNGFGALGVDMFFVISGAVMGMALRRDVTPRSFLRARFIRVVPLFWLAAIVTIGLSLVLGDPLTIERLANSITIFPLLDLGTIDTPLPPVGWTLAFELYFYLIVGLALNMPKKIRSYVVFAILIACASMGLLSQPIRLPIMGIGFNALLLEFALGLLALRAAQQPIVIWHAPWLVALGVAPLFYSVMIGFGFSNAPEAAVVGQTSVAHMLAWGVPSAMVLTGLIARPDRMRATSPWVRLGDASYALYLAHWPIMMLLPKLWPWTGAMGSDLLFGMLVAVGIGAGVLMHHYVELPLLLRLRQTSDKRGWKVLSAA